MFFLDMLLIVRECGGENLEVGSYFFVIKYGVFIGVLEDFLL